MSKYGGYNDLMIACDLDRFKLESPVFSGDLWNMVIIDRYSIATMAVDKSKINETNHCGETSLIIACKFKNNGQIIDLLLENGAEVNSSDYYGITPLMNACINNLDSSIVETFISNGAIVNEIDSSGRSALIYACEVDVDISIIEVLVNNGADVNMKNNDGNTAIMLCRMRVIYPTETFDEEKIRYLMDNSADVNITNKLGETLLIMMCIYSKDQDVNLFEKIIVESNVTTTDLQGNTAYHYYQQHGCDLLDENYLKMLKGEYLSISSS